MMNKITSIAVIPQNVQVYDMCFDWTGTKLAVACSDKTIRIFEKKSDETWNDYPSIKTGGPAVWKVKWARP
jgi:WD40 repeat protein